MIELQWVSTAIVGMLLVIGFYNRSVRSWFTQLLHLIAWLVFSCAALGWIWQPTLEKRVTHSFQGQPLQGETWLKYWIKQQPANVIDYQGNGQRSFQWRQLSGRDISIELNQPELTIQPTWPSKVVLGDMFQLELDVDNQTNKNFTFELVAPDNTLAAQQKVLGNSRSKVDFKTLPKSIGRWEFQLNISDSDLATNSMPIPVQVIQATPPKVKAIASSPSFRWQGLFRWLKQTGVKADFQYRVSADRFTRINTDGAIETEDADLLLIQANEWALLSEQQQQNLLTRANRKQLGLLIWLDAGKDEQVDQFSKALNLTLQTYPIEQSLFKTTKPDESIGNKQTDLLGVALSDPDSSVYPAFVASDSLIGLLAVDGSYAWLTSNYANAYSSLWKSMLQPLLPLDSDKQFVPKQRFAELNQRLDWCRPKPSESDIRVSVERFSVTDNLFQSGDQCVSVWPTKEGWQTVTINKNTYDYYVYQASDWIAWREYLAYTETLEFIARQALTATDYPTAEYRRLNLLPDWAYLMLLVGSLALLWFEEKFLR